MIETEHSFTVDTKTQRQQRISTKWAKLNNQSMTGMAVYSWSSQETVRRITGVHQFSSNADETIPPIFFKILLCHVHQIYDVGFAHFATINCAKHYIIDVLVSLSEEKKLIGHPWSNLTRTYIQPSHHWTHTQIQTRLTVEWLVQFISTHTDN